MNLNRRNYPPDHGIRVPYDDLHGLIERIFVEAGMSAEDAGLLATILGRNNQRCIYSHGTGQIPHYLERIREGAVNPKPELQVVSEAPSALVMDGDGGLGYFACWRGTERLIEKAKETGIAALTTSNHHHYGSAGNYTRLAVEYDCIGLSFSSHRGNLKPENPIANIVDSSPISIALPAGEQPAVVMDMGGGLMRYDEGTFENLPKSVFKAMALSAAVRTLGGVFPGIYTERVKASPWEANQGAFIVVVDVAHFMAVDEMKREMDQFVEMAQAMKPLPGMDRSVLAGGNEFLWERENIEQGIPMSDDHCSMLVEEGEGLGVSVSFESYEETRF
jgi:LDH2 family malate/lactate/ureidoglycolate dehydrogenase